MAMFDSPGSKYLKSCRVSYNILISCGFCCISTGQNGIITIYVTAYDCCVRVYTYWTKILRCSSLSDKLVSRLRENVCTSSQHLHPWYSRVLCWYDGKNHQSTISKYCVQSMNMYLNDSCPFTRVSYAVTRTRKSYNLQQKTRNNMHKHFGFLAQD